MSITDALDGLSAQDLQRYYTPPPGGWDTATVVERLASALDETGHASSWQFADPYDDDSDELASSGFDGYGDVDDMDGEDEDDTGFDPDSDTHEPMSVNAHRHGSYAVHSHDGDNDHSDAMPYEDAGAQSHELAEMAERLGGGARKVARMDYWARIALYEKAAAVTGYGAEYQLSESASRRRTSAGREQLAERLGDDGGRNSIRLQRRAERLAREQGRALAELSPDRQMQLYERAARQVGY